MRLQGNWLSLISWRAFSKSSSEIEVSMRKLSSGLRIDRASDDVAGLSISQSLLVQYRGLVQANRNALDGISLLNTAEGALQEIHTMLQRGRELALQAANDVYTPEDKKQIQVELVNILTEIDRIADTTTFNGRRLFNEEGNASLVGSIVYGLRSGWLEQAARVIESQYGLTGDGAKLRIQLETTGPTSSWVSGTPDVNGAWQDVTLHLNLSQFALSTSSVAIAEDRKVGKALTQATLARTTPYQSLPEWFASGVADYLVGRDEQLATDIATHGIDAVVNAIATPWQDDSLHQSSAYLLVKFLAAQLPGDGVRNVIDQLNLANGGNDLDSALMFAGGPDSATLLAQFLDPGFFGGAAFASTLNLSDSDVGSIGSGTNDTVIPDGGQFSDNPLFPQFDIEWFANGTFDPIKISLHVGANTQDRIEFDIPHLSTYALNLIGVNVVSRAQQAVDLISEATNKVSTIRSHLGAITNRLEKTVAANAQSAEAQLSSYSRIRDLDFAREMTDLTRQQILLQSSGAILAQANTARQNVKWLLNGLSTAPVGRAAAFQPSFGPS